MDEQEYLTQRVEPGIRWYSEKSKLNKLGFRLLKLIEIVFALLIPFLTGYIPGHPPLISIVGALGLLIAATSGITTLLHFQENWIHYRAVAETLKVEKFMYLTKVGPYEGDDPFKTFVAKCEGHMLRENIIWVGENKPQKSNGTKPQKQTVKTQL